MPTNDSSARRKRTAMKPKPCGKCSDDLKGSRWVVASTELLDSGVGREQGFGPAGRGWYWVGVCTPCHVALRGSER